MENIINMKEGNETHVSRQFVLFLGLKYVSSKGLKVMSFFLILTLLSTAGFASNGIAKLILQAKAEGSQFIAVNNLLIANTRFSSQAIEREVINPKYFDFNNRVAMDLINNRKQHITITLPNVTAKGESLILDLIAVPEPYYEARITTSSGLRYTARDVNLVHYRGVLRNQEMESIVMLSIADDNVSVDISIKDGSEYEMYYDKRENIHVFYDYLKIPNAEEPFQCIVDTTTLDSIETRGTKAPASDKCVYLYLEVEHEVFLEADDLDDIQEKMLKIYNKTATMFENVDVAIRLRELRIWNTVDPYDYIVNPSISDTLNWHFKKEQYIDSVIMPKDVNYAHLVTAFALGGILGSGGNFICIDGVNDPRPSIGRFNGGCSNGACRRSYVKTVSHEIGHGLDSDHTHDCTWNGNCTRLDNNPGGTSVICPGGLPSACGSGSDIDYYYETIMSYHGGLKYWKGFRDQPGERIKNFVNSQGCLSSCDVSCNDIKDVINVGAYQDVNSGDDDYRHSEIVTNVYNEIDAGGEASYYSATDVYLKPDFRANNGSEFYAAIKPCVYYGNERIDNSYFDIAESTINEGGFSVDVYPNPSFSGIFTIETENNSIASYLEVLNLMGTVIHSSFIGDVKLSNFDISNYPKGIYLIRLIDGEKSITQKIIYN